MNNTELDTLEFLSQFKEDSKDSEEMKEIKSAIIQFKKCEITKKNDKTDDEIKISNEKEFDKAYI